MRYGICLMHDIEGTHCFAGEIQSVMPEAAHASRRSWEGSPLIEALTIGRVVELIPWPEIKVAVFDPSALHHPLEEVPSSLVG